MKEIGKLRAGRTGLAAAVLWIGAAAGGQGALRMPELETGAMPARLSETGAFADVAGLRAEAGLIPYDINVPFWSDGAEKRRWMAAPEGKKIIFRERGEWTFPRGTIFVKHFELATNEAHPEWKRRLETRLLVCDAAGGVYGVTYKWRDDNSDADLLLTNLTETIAIQTATGVRTQQWYYPSRQDCVTCHTVNAGLVLGVKTRQLNRDYTMAGVMENELRAWNRRGLFERGPVEADITNFARLANGGDVTRSVEDRARSYLDANCAHCHRPGGTVANFDARYDTPLERQNLIGGQILIDQGIDAPRAIAPHDVWRSMVYMRASSADAIKMPPLAHAVVDEAGMRLLREWIESLPGPPVLAPPKMSPAPGNYTKAIEVTLDEAEPGATVRYTLDGSLPTVSDPIYEKPIRLSGSDDRTSKSF